MTKRKTLRIDDVKKLNLLQSSILIAEMYSENKSAVNGAVFAHLAKQLLEAETQPGGPYEDSSAGTMPRLNAAIGRLFLLMGNPLPNIDNYIEELDTSGLTSTDLIAIEKYKTLRDEVPAVQVSHESSKPYALARAALKKIKEPVRTQALQFLARVELADSTSEIANFAYFTNEAFSANIAPAKLDTLGEANIHGWIAYMIYDHIIDGEADTGMLPVANICMRLSLDRYKSVLPEDHTLHVLINHYFDQVDSANAWELAQCRFEVSDTTITTHTLPDYQQYGQLARGTGIHILGPVIVASLATPKNKKMIKLDQFVRGLEQYLIARQLSDDIHDWKEDLQAGRISAVVARLLQNYDVQPDETYDLTELTSILQDDFLQQTSGDISTLIILYARNAAECLEEAGCDMSSELADLVARLENIATASITQQSHFLEFQDEYKKNVLSVVPEIASS